VNALRIITADPNVKAILFNIFGGITRTDDVANGIVTATKANPLKVPIVIRLTGTNEEIAMKILKDNGFSASSDMDTAVQEGRRSSPREGSADEHLHRQEHQARHPGHHGPRRLVPRQADDGVRHQVVAGVTPGKGGQKFEGTVPIFNTVPTP
jgi:succinyl-CoA synthetase alpha subunit